MLQQSFPKQAARVLPCAACANYWPRKRKVTVVRLINASRYRCHDCETILNGLEAYYVRHKLTRKFNLSSLEIERIPSVVDVSPLVDISMIFEFKRPGKRSSGLGPLEYYTVDSETKSRFPLARHVAPSAASSDCLSAAAQLLARCAGEHRCQIKNNTFVPRRLIDTKSSAPDNEDIVLVDDADLKLQGNIVYAALSYCWGDEAIVKANMLAMTTTNLENMTEGIRFLSLPRVFQDAVTVVRSMDIRYLWIDAVCIAQGDPQDWAKESIKMRDIYSSAYVTIIAATSFSCDLSFLNYESRTWDYDCRSSRQAIEIPGSKKKDVSPAVFVRRARSCFVAGPSATSTRAWILQELLMSPRVLFFEEHGFLFHCRKGDVREDGVRNANKNHPEIASRNAWITALSAKNVYKDQTRDQGLWHNVVENYSRRSLTKSSDKLPAIAGLASAYKQKVGVHGRYLAGLWEHNLLFDLLWRTTNHDGQYMIASPAPSYRAPSWSWASIDGPVGYISKELTKAWWSGEHTMNARVIAAECNSSGRDEFVGVDSGFVILEGPSRRIYLMSNEHDIDGFDFCEKSAKDTNFVKKRFTPDTCLKAMLIAGSFAFTAGRASYSKTDFQGIHPVVHVLWLHSFNHGSNRAGLVLGRTASTAEITYERLGVLSIESREFRGLSWTEWDKTMRFKIV